MLFENFRIALRSILANKMRSFLTTLGIIIGVAAVIAVVSIVQGLNFWISDQLQGVGATYILVVPNNDRNNPDHVGRDIRLTYDDGQAILERVPEIAAFTPIFFTGERVRLRDRSATPFVLGVGASYQEVVNHWVEKGRFFSDLDLQSRARVCLVGRKIIEDLGLPEDPLGADLLLGRATFTIVGVMEKKGEFLGQNRDQLILVPFSTAREIYGEEAMRQIRLDFKARSPRDVDRAKELMTSILRDRHGLRGSVSNDFEILLQEEILKTTSTILGTITKVVGAVVGIALLVGGIGIMNIMLVSVTERTREIGVRKAVGARRADVLMQFLIEAVTLSALGGTIGIALGWGLGALGAAAIPGFPAAHVPVWAVFLAFGFASVVGVLFGVYPAGKAARLDPIDSLRYE
ncbi:MAG TPA: ABC transporter permease [Thermoanaerobaculaceae bacterium]|nr:ABC transporter permease [Thermoanaerobaculaceae bacterium]HRS14801.1 ABC transporter permease [Thermoanaerobaculaceae bacterium]